MSEDLSFYIVRIRGGVDEYYISPHEGEQLVAKLMERLSGKPNQEFVEFEDVSGSSICVQVSDIQAVFLTTPGIREQDMTGDLHRIRLALNEVIKAEREDKNGWGQ